MKIINGVPEISPLLSKAEISDFLCSGRMNLFLVTKNIQNQSDVHPVWYIYENDRFYFATEKISKKSKNIQKNDFVSFSVASECEPYMGLNGKGAAKILESSKNTLLAKKIVSKYMDDLGNKLAKEIFDEIENGTEVIIEIIPEYFSAWSYKRYFSDDY